MKLSFSTLVSNFLAAAVISPNGHVVDSQLIESYSRHACNLFLGELQCWGDARGLYPSDLDAPIFINLPDSESGSPIKLADVYSTTFAVLDNGKVYGWGGGQGDMLGDSVPTGEARTDPVVVQFNDQSGTPQDLSGVVDIKGGGHHICAKHDDLSLTCWGNTGYGAPSGEYDGTSLSKQVKLFDTGSRGTCVVSMDGKMKCFFWLQDITYDSAATGNNILDIQYTGDQACIMTDEVGANLWCFGSNVMKEI